MNGRASSLCAGIIALVTAAASAHAAALILNEYNAVDKDRYLRADTYSEDNKEDTYFATRPGLPDGRIQGNGGNWIELVVVRDYVNIQGWQLRWAETGADDTDGTDLWFGNSQVEQGILTFSPSAAIWSNLRMGTIITISQEQFIDVDTDFDPGGNRNFTRSGDSDGTWEVTINLSTDTSYDPLDDDWWIHVSTEQEQQRYHDSGGLYDPLVRAVNNVDGDGPGKFSVGPADWQLRIVDDQGSRVFGPIGEDIDDWGGGGVNDREVGKLQDEPSTSVEVGDFEDGSTSTFGLPNVWRSGERYQTFDDLRAWVPEPTTLLLLAAAVPFALRRRRARA